MTIKELYEYALERGCENEPLILNAESIAKDYNLSVELSQEYDCPVEQMTKEFTVEAYGDGIVLSVEEA